MLTALVFLTLLSEPRWHTSYEAAHAEAKASGKVLVVYFSTPDCHWCRKLEAGPLADPGVRQLLSRCVCVKLDGSHPVARAMNVRLFPTLIASKWDAKDGHMIEKARVTGYTDSRSLRVKIEGVK